MTNRRRVRLLGAGFSGSMFTIAGLAQFIEPGGWAIWPTLVLLLIAIWCWVGLARATRDIFAGKEDA